jgi:hypothetical protein
MVYNGTVQSFQPRDVARLGETLWFFVVVWYVSPCLVCRETLFAGFLGQHLDLQLRVF